MPSAVFTTSDSMLRRAIPAFVFAALGGVACELEEPEPFFGFVRPLDGAFVSGVAELEVDSTPIGRVQEVVFSVGAVELGRATEPPYVIELDTAVYSDGPLDITADAVLPLSDAGEPVPPASIALLVDNELPSVEILLPYAAFREDGDEIPFRLLVSDGNGIAKVGVRAVGDGTDVGRILHEPASLVALSLAWDEVRPGTVEDWSTVRVIASAVDKHGRESTVEQTVHLGTRRLWSANVAGLMLRPPLVADDGTVFVGSTKVSPDEGRVVRLDPADGGEMCQAPLGEETVYSLTQAGALIVFGTSRAVRAIRRDDCGLAWTFGDPVGSPRSYWGTPAYDAGAGLVYAADAGGTVVAINATTGAGGNFATAAEEIQSSPVILATGEVIVGGASGNLYAYDAAGTPLAWSPYATAGSIFGDPVVADGIVYFGSMDTFVYALDPNTGSMLSGFGVTPDGFAIRSTPGIAPDGTVLVATIGGQMHAIRADGSDFWGYDTGAISRGGVLVQEHADSSWSVYVGSTTGIVHAVDQQGDEIWRADTDAEIQTYGALGGAALYMPSDNFHLFAYDVRSPVEVDTP